MNITKRFVTKHFLYLRNTNFNSDGTQEQSYLSKLFHNDMFFVKHNKNSFRVNCFE